MVSADKSIVISVSVNVADAKPKKLNVSGSATVDESNVLSVSGNVTDDK